jgi:argininosuccinate lyase
MEMRAEKQSSYTVSIHYDWRLYREDISGSIAHVRMLARQKILSIEDRDVLIKGLTKVREEIESGEFPWRHDLEDIHMNIEARLYELIGEPAGRLHTARSRNDQVATDLRLYVLRIADETIELIRGFQRVLLNTAQSHLNIVMPGYTHLQRAQPVLLAHHILAYFEMFNRDRCRFQQVRIAADVLPLGSGALAGAPYLLDREFVAKELGFTKVSSNSMDAVSDRDFVIDYLSASSIMMMHVSRLAEELVLWSSSEFDFVQFSDKHTTGSSIMPQKRNPDIAELARGRSGRVFGHLIGLLVVLKGLPLTYNRDLQEDKEALFDAIDTVQNTLRALTEAFAGLEFKAIAMRDAADQNYSLATDIADYLVSKGMPFRRSHGVVNSLVRSAEVSKKSLSEMTLEEYQAFSPLFDTDVFKITLDSALAARDVRGGTAPQRVKEALREAWGTLSGQESYPPPFPPDVHQ